MSTSRSPLVPPRSSRPASSVARASASRPSARQVSECSKRAHCLASSTLCCSVSAIDLAPHLRASRSRPPFRSAAPIAIAARPRSCGAWRLARRQAERARRSASRPAPASPWSWARSRTSSLNATRSPVSRSSRAISSLSAIAALQSADSPCTPERIARRNRNARPKPCARARVMPSASSRNASRL